MAEKKTTARKPRATKASKEADAPADTTPGAQTFRPEPLPQRTGTHTRDYDPK